MPARNKFDFYKVFHLALWRFRDFALRDATARSFRGFLVGSCGALGFLSILYLCFELLAFLLVGVGLFRSFGFGMICLGFSMICLGFSMIFIRWIILAIAFSFISYVLDKVFIISHLVISILFMMVCYSCTFFYVTSFKNILYAFIKLFS